ncbi:uncharacterized protein LOC122013838 [Zingiber officinale]|uniref:uncharacterized protein LOC122013838 n=1 Tax=Zingiber officinale TaxID=94328 RepID=UPI001C4CF9FE|nr:uncharacterized protein LOC122013838 [Zingiber officinale]
MVEENPEEFKEDPEMFEKDPEMDPIMDLMAPQLTGHNARTSGGETKKKELHLLGDRVEEALTELDGCCQNSRLSEPFRLKARILECFQSNQVATICTFIMLIVMCLS